MAKLEVLDDVKHGIMTIGPALAQEWLTNKTGKQNRKCSATVVNRYARDMSRGKWIFNGEPIQFDTDGNLLNGQHRLNAIVQSGTTHQFMVLSGLSSESHQGMDSGKGRTPGDVLTLAGYSDGKTLAAVARMALSVDVNPNVARYARNWSAQEIKRRIESDSGLENVVVVDLPELPSALFNVATRSVIGYCLYRFDQIAPDAAREFMHSLGTLANLPEGSPILALHRRLTASSTSKTTARQWESVAYIFMAWNAWRRNEYRSLIKLSTDGNGRIRLVNLES